MSEDIFANWKPFKIDKKCLLFHLKGSFFSLKAFEVMFRLFSNVEKQLAQRDSVNFKIYVFGT